MERSAADVWLRGSYFHPNEDNPALFVFRSTGLLFRYLFDSRLLGIPGVVLALGGAVMLAVRPAAPARRLGALLLGLPFVLAATLALAGLQPYGGSRHGLYLMPFAAGLAGYCFAALARQRMALLLPGLVVVLPVWALLAPKPEMRIADQRQATMAAAVAHIRRTIPAGSTIFCDFQTSQLLGYYLGRESFADFPPAVSELGQGNEFVSQVYSGYGIVSSVKYWSFTPEDFGDELRRFRERTQGFEDSRIRGSKDSVPGFESLEPVWMVSAGWGPTLCSERNRVFPDFQCEQVRTFGDNIAVFAVRPRLQGENLAAMADLAQQMSSRPGVPVRTVLLPSDLFESGVVQAVQEPGRQVTTYSRFYEALSSGRTRPSDRLPALAFWQFNTRERHVQGFGYMNDRESYDAGGYRFTLIAVSIDSSAAAYLVESGR
jgi:hypothetical protein